MAIFLQQADSENELAAFGELVHKHAEVFAAPAASTSKAASSQIQEQALHTAKRLFDESLKDEQSHLPAFASLYVALQSNGFNSITTRSQSSKGKGRAPTVQSLLARDPLFQPTGLDELYLGDTQQQPASSSVDSDTQAQMVWQQLNLRVARNLELFQGLCDMDPDSDPEQMGSEDGLEDESAEDSSDATVEEELLNDGVRIGNATDEDDEDEDNENEDDEMSDISANEADMLENDSDGFEDESDDLEEKLANGGDDKVTKDGQRSQKTARYLAKLRDDTSPQPSANNSLPHLKKGKWRAVPTAAGKSPLDAGFFSLSDFNSQTDLDEEEMRRYMGTGRSKSANDVVRGLDGLIDGEDEDEDIDYFVPAGTVGGSDDEEAEDDDEEGEDGVRPEDMRYDDFWNPPSKLYGDDREPGKTVKDGRAKVDKANSKGKGRAELASADKKGGKRRVSFHEDVTVQEFESDSKNQTAIAALVKKVGMKEALKKISSGEVDEDELLVPDDEEALDDDEDDDSDSPEDAEEEEELDDDAEGGMSDNDDTSNIGGKGDSGGRTMQRLQRDLLSDDNDSENQKGSVRQSRHEQRMASLSEQIAQLEQENVAAREWTLRGEVGSRARPINSLLEEDLEFEQVAKVVPVVTEETSQSLEDKIKQRVLDDNFDDVVRRRPMETAAYLPSRLLDIRDTQSDRSLAEIYADEFSTERTRAEGGTEKTPEIDAKLQKEHDNIKSIFDELCYKLDALSNAHFTPKAAQTVITSVMNVPSITMESALPTAASISTMLAPEEVYAPSQSGALTSKSEMTPSQKKAARTKARKARAQTLKTIEKYGGRTSSVKKAKDQAMSSLIGKRGVTVVGSGKAKTAGKDRKKHS